MPDVRNFSEISADFDALVRRIVWSTVTTVDRKGRPRSRILHPAWEGTTGWIMTGRHTLKEKHLAANPYVSCSYWDPQHETAFVECRAEWADDLETRERIWSLFKSLPEPYGYDPAMFWPEGPASDAFGLLKLTPWRLELWSISEMANGKPPRVWRGEG